MLIFAASCRSFTGKSFKGGYKHDGETPQPASACAGFSSVTVRDPRPEPQLIGDRSRESRAGSFPVTMTGDVGAWVREGFESQARAGSFAIGNVQSPALTITVNTIDLRERVASNSDYRARIVLDVQLIVPTGQSCLVGSFEGNGKNFGSDGSADNYAQTLNRALDAVSVAILNAPAFRDAACGKCATGDPPPPTPPPQ